MKKHIIFAGFTLVLTACSTPYMSNQPLESWSNFKSSLVSGSQLAENQSLAVFYRQADIQGPAVNVYVNGDYQTSLLPNSFSPIAVCSANNLFSSSFSTNVSFGNRKQGVHYTLPAKEVAYVKVMQDSNGKLNFIRVEANLAEQEIMQLKKVNQTLSRVMTPSLCGERVLAVASLDASALFAFNKSSYQDILEKGKQDIANFAKEIKHFDGSTKILVSGHTDPSGSELYNLRLSQKRADTVKLALQQLGITVPIDAVGYGKSQPIVSHCESLSGKEKQVCNQPNRRVEITVYGK